MAKQQALGAKNQYLKRKLSDKGWKSLTAAEKNYVRDNMRSEFNKHALNMSFGERMNNKLQNVRKSVGIQSPSIRDNDKKMSKRMNKYIESQDSEKKRLEDAKDRKMNTDTVKKNTNPKKQVNKTNAAKQEINTKGRSEGFKVKAKRPKRSKGENAEYGGRTSMDGKTPPKPAPNPKTERQRQKELNRSPAAIKARKEAYSKKNSLSGNSINNEQKMAPKQKGFASGGSSRKNTSGSTDARKGVVTKALSKLFNDKRSKAEMTKTRKDNQSFWDDNGPDK